MVRAKNGVFGTEPRKPLHQQGRKIGYSMVPPDDMAVIIRKREKKKEKEKEKEKEGDQVHGGYSNGGPDRNKKHSRRKESKNETSILLPLERNAPSLSHNICPTCSSHSPHDILGNGVTSPGSVNTTLPQDLDGSFIHDGQLEYVFGLGHEPFYVWTCCRKRVVGTNASVPDKESSGIAPLDVFDCHLDGCRQLVPFGEDRAFFVKAVALTQQPALSLPCYTMNTKRGPATRVLLEEIHGCIVKARSFYQEHFYLKGSPKIIDKGARSCVVDSFLGYCILDNWNMPPRLFRILIGIPFKEGDVVHP